MGGGFPIKAFGNDKLVLTEVGNGQCITSLPNVYPKTVSTSCTSFRLVSLRKSGFSRFLLASKSVRVFANRVIRVLFSVLNKFDSIQESDALLSQVKNFGSKDNAVLQTFEITSENASALRSFIL